MAGWCYMLNLGRLRCCCTPCGRQMCDGREIFVIRWASEEQMGQLQLDTSERRSRRGNNGRCGGLMASLLLPSLPGIRSHAHCLFGMACPNIPHVPHNFGRKSTECAIRTRRSLASVDMQRPLLYIPMPHQFVAHSVPTEQKERDLSSALYLHSCRFN